MAAGQAICAEPEASEASGAPALLRTRSRQLEANLADRMLFI